MSDPIGERWICPDCGDRIIDPYCPRCGKTIVDASERVEADRIKELGP
jgi:predicted RNA-binding Zn-ribbon protein involved in translation (DUF1610 family)